jgi:hypothetical protein
MSETMQEAPVSTTYKENMEQYFKTHDLKYVADDAVFINMSSGERTEGKEAIGNMLNFMYHIAFDAHAKIINTIITRDKALLEAEFKGKHIGEFAGMQPTQKEVNVPLAVSYDLEDGLVKVARIYMPDDVMMKQLA